ncbi:MAG: DUF2795 domain-containing protein [Actinomycetales bacterium]|nr:DUF2795 domain-containing protein [Actinomycetales bacterium]
MGEQTGPRARHRDDQLKHEVIGLIRSGRSSRAEEWRDPEPAAEDRPTGDTGIVPEDRRGTPEGMTSRDVEDRFEVARFLGPSAFPADRDGLLQVAQANRASDRVVDLLRDLPDGERYRNVQDVARALGVGTETRRG